MLVFFISFLSLLGVSVFSVPQSAASSAYRVNGKMPVPPPPPPPGPPPPPTLAVVSDAALLLFSSSFHLSVNPLNWFRLNAVNQ